MSLDRRLLAWNLFERFVELDEQGQSALLRDECGRDDELRRQVERLLACDKRAAERRFLADSPLAVRFLHDGDDLIGREIGPYRLEQQIGQGGMGYVYRAVRSADYQQTAAVKIVRAGRGDSNLVRAFQNEVQLLAKVRQHPRIVGLMDAGMTPDGFAYLVMDYVPGQPLDEYCQARRLNWRQRLQLFLQVCDAVAFAHRQLVTHRDLKPRNILVLEGGEAKLLDFGIAREESFGGEQTRTVVRAFTPDYASPEQVRGESLSTLTDVYSLGVILFQLLTGRRPYDTTHLSPAELERRVCETDPPPLTAASSRTADGKQGCELPSREIARDLDAIILKAMAKQADERYGTVAALSDDIERLLRGDAVLARKRSTSYVVRKFLWRHRVLVATTSVILASLVIALVGVGLGLGQARREQRRTEASLTLNRDTVRKFMELLDRQQIGRIPGSQSSRLELQQVLQSAAETLHRDLARDEASREQLAVVDLKVGQLFVTLGDRDQALEYLHRARQANESLLAMRTDDDDVRKALGDCWQTIGAVHQERLEQEECESAIGKSLGHFRAITDPNLADVAKIGEGASLSIVGRLAFERRDFKTAREHYELADTLFRAVHVRRPEDVVILEKLGQVDNDLCAIELAGENFAAAESRGRTGVAVVERLTRQFPWIVDYQVMLGRGLTNLGNALNRQKKYADALATYERADERWARVVEQNPDVVSYLSERSAVLRNAGTACLWAKDHDEAIRYYSRSIGIRERVASLVNDKVSSRHGLAMAYRSLGEVFDEAGRFDEALVQFDKADAIHQDLAEQFPANAAFLNSFGHTQHARGMALKRMGRYADAVPAYEAGIRWCTLAAKNSSDFSQNADVLTNLHIGLLEVHRATADASALLARLEAFERAFVDSADHQADIGVQWALSALVKAPSGEPLIPIAAERGRALLEKVRASGVDLSELMELPLWPELSQLPGYRVLVEPAGKDDERRAKDTANQ